MAKHATPRLNRQITTFALTIVAAFLLVGAASLRTQDVPQADEAGGITFSATVKGNDKIKPESDKKSIKVPTNSEVTVTWAPSASLAGKKYTVTRTIGGEERAIYSSTGDQPT